MKVLPILNSDSYKQFHHMMYPKGMTKLYSNMTPRSYKRLNNKYAVWFGMQYYIKEYLLDQWNHLFFNRPLGNILEQYKRFHKHFSFSDVTTGHIEKLHNLGYLPIKIKALPEGSLVPSRVPFYTIVNTHQDHAWLVNFLETQMSTVLWDLTTNATISRMYKELLTGWANKTGDESFVQWQGHDFAQRGRSSVESTFNQAGHLLSFTGTDTIPAVLFLEEYYNADMEKELIGSSVPATEHSVMTSYGKEEEINAFARLLDQFHSGILSVVSDSFDLWKVCTEYIVTLKEKILARNGKLVIRPDSGDPVNIICGSNVWDDKQDFEETDKTDWNLNAMPNEKGVVELLWDAFGGTVNEKGYKVLDSHIGVIYGDAITLARAEEICQRLEQKGFASTNVVLGIGSYTYNCNTRDTLGIAVKSTYCEVDSIPREIFKDPVTDDGTKKSLKGLLYVGQKDGELFVEDQVSSEKEQTGLLTEVFVDGKMVRETSLSEIRNRLNNAKPV
jgi:nicotinamide phosphoribosyltransferase